MDKSIKNETSVFFIRHFGIKLLLMEQFIRYSVVQCDVNNNLMYINL